MAPTVEDLLGRFADTQARWSLLVGKVRVYDPVRAMLHELWLGQALTGNPVAEEEQPTALVLAGGPASGKSTLRRRIQTPASPTVIDPDWFKEQIPEYAELVAAREPRAAAIAHEESSDLAHELLQRGKAARHNLILDMVGDSPPGDFVKQLRELVAAGYRVEVVYADVPTDLAWDRAQARAEQTGRLVPEPVLRAKHAAVAARYEEVVAEPGIASVLLYDCTGPEPRLIESVHAASPPRREVHDAGRLKAFLAKGRT